MMARVVLLSQSTLMHERTFSEQVICVSYDSRCGMSAVAFCTAPPFGGPSCYSHLIVSDFFLYMYNN